MLRQQSDILKHYALVRGVLHLRNDQFSLTSIKPITFQGLLPLLCHFLVSISASQTMVIAHRFQTQAYRRLGDSRLPPVVPVA